MTTQTRPRFSSPEEIASHIFFYKQSKDWKLDAELWKHVDILLGDPSWLSFQLRGSEISLRFIIIFRLFHCQQQHREIN